MAGFAATIKELRARVEQNINRSRALREVMRSLEALPPDAPPGERQAIMDRFEDIEKHHREFLGLYGSDTKAGDSVSGRHDSKDDKE